jgi:hypothetical protein
VRVTLLGYLKGKQKDRHAQGPEEIVTALRELWDNITFEELQTMLESWRDRLRWIIDDPADWCCASRKRASISDSAGRSQTGGRKIWILPCYKILEFTT